MLDLCFVKEEYFRENSEFINMLDPGDYAKQSHRTHLCLEIEHDDNKFFVPLRNNLGLDVRKFGRIGHSIPSQSRPDAGLDFRYALIINDDSFIERQMVQGIPNAQYKKITREYDTIKKEFEVYFRGFKRAVRKGRVEKEPLYRVSSLVNYIDVIEI